APSAPLLVLACDAMRRVASPRPARLDDLDHLDVEDERGVGGDGRPGPPRAVRLLRGDRQLAPAADLHAGDADVPALDDPPLPERERERLAPVARAVELGAVGQRARVVDRDDVA